MNKHNFLYYFTKVQVLEYNRTAKEYIGNFVKKAFFTHKKPKLENEPLAFQQSKELLKISKTHRTLFDLNDKKQSITVHISDNKISLDVNHCSPFCQSAYFNSQRNYKLLKSRKYSRKGCQFNRMSNPNYFMPSSLQSSKLLGHYSVRKISKRSYSVKNKRTKLDKNNSINVTKNEFSPSDNSSNEICNLVKEKFWNLNVPNFIITIESIIKSFLYRYFPCVIIQKGKNILSQEYDLQKLFTRDKFPNENINDTCDYCKSYFVNQPLKILKKKNLIPDFKIKSKNIHTNRRVVPECKEQENSELLLDKNFNENLKQNKIRTGNYISLNEAMFDAINNRTDEKNLKVIQTLIQTYKTDNSRESLDESEEGKKIHRNSYDTDEPKGLYFSENTMVNNQILAVGSKPFSLDSRIWRNYIDSIPDPYQIENEIESQKLSNILTAANYRIERQYDDSFAEHSTSHTGLSMLTRNYYSIDENLKKIKNKVKELYNNLTAHKAEYSIGSVNISKPSQSNQESDKIPQISTEELEPSHINDNKNKKLAQHFKKERSFDKPSDNEKTEKDISNEDSEINEPAKTGTIYKNFDDPILFEDRKKIKTQSKMYNQTQKSIYSDRNNSLNETLEDAVKLEGTFNYSEDYTLKENDETDIDDNEKKLFAKGDDENLEFLEKCVVKLTEDDSIIKQEAELTDKLTEKIQFLNGFCDKINKMNEIIIQNKIDKHKKFTATDIIDGIYSKQKKLDIISKLGGNSFNFQQNNELKEKTKDFEQPKSEKKQKFTMPMMKTEFKRDEYITNSKDSISKLTGKYFKKNITDQEKPTNINRLTNEINYIRSVRNPSLYLTDVLQKCTVFSADYKLLKCMKNTSTKESEPNNLSNSTKFNENEKIRSDEAKTLSYLRRDGSYQKTNSAENDVIENSLPLNLDHTRNINHDQQIAIPKEFFKTHLKEIKMKDDVLVLNITIKIPFASLDLLMDNEDIIGISQLKDKKSIKNKNQYDF